MLRMHVLMGGISFQLHVYEQERAKVHIMSSTIDLKS